MLQLYYFILDKFNIGNIYFTSIESSPFKSPKISYYYFLRIFRFAAFYVIVKNNNHYLGFTQQFKKFVTIVFFKLFELAR